MEHISLLQVRSAKTWNIVSCLVTSLERLGLRDGLIQQRQALIIELLSYGTRQITVRLTPVKIIAIESLSGESCVGRDYPLG